MAVLSNAAREALFGSLSKELSVTRTSTSLLKGELRAAVNAADSWIDSNAASFNAALPQPARGAMSGVEKARLLMYVIRRRFEEAA